MLRRTSQPVYACLPCRGSVLLIYKKRMWVMYLSKACVQAAVMVREMVEEKLSPAWKYSHGGGVVENMTLARLSDASIAAPMQAVKICAILMTRMLQSHVEAKVRITSSLLVLWTSLTIYASYVR